MFSKENDLRDQRRRWEQVATDFNRDCVYFMNLKGDEKVLSIGLRRGYLECAILGYVAGSQNR